MGTSPRRIDPRAHRLGAGLSAVMLATGLLVQAAPIVPLVAVTLLVSALFGTRYSILGRPWPLVRRALRLAPPAELESEFPARFAQLLGAGGLALATGLLVAGTATAGWVVASVVAGLQLTLALTGYCLGCRLYGLRWYAPRLFDRLLAVSSRDAAG